MIEHVGIPIVNTCSVRGCEARTREGKPFCPAHILEMPYVVGILDRVERRAAEAEGVPRSNGLLAEDLVCIMLENSGAMTFTRLKKLMNVSADTLDNLVIKMKVAGRLRERDRMSRIGRTLSLVNPAATSIRRASSRP